MILQNKLIILTLATILQLFLSGQENAPKSDNYDQIRVRPFYEIDLPEKITDKPLQQEPNLTAKTNSKTVYKPAEWVLESSLENAPKLIKGILAYLKLGTHHNRNYNSINIPSFHRMILVGPPGSGKTTMAYAIGYDLDCSVIFTSASTFLGQFRNQTSHNLQEFFKRYTADNSRKVIIIDELHKLFEHFENDKSDDSQSAATFWLILDSIERYCPNIIIIGTANNVKQLPPEIKSRFSGKVITIPSPNKKCQIKAFKNSIIHDKTVSLDECVTNEFIKKMLDQIPDCSLRNIQLLIDTAKMFYCAENCMSEEFAYMRETPIILTPLIFSKHLINYKKNLRF